MLKARRVFAVLISTILIGSLGVVSADVAAQAPQQPIVLMVGAAGPLASDTDMRVRLEATGHPVLQVDESAAEEIAGLDPALVVVSVSVSARRVEASGLADLDVPILTWEPFIADDLAMSERNGVTRTTDKQRHIEIADPSHPVAIGLSGEADVLLRRSTVSWGSPGPGAEVVATAPGRPDRAVIYSYPAGARLTDGQPAPACRVFLFPSATSAHLLSELGQAVVDATIDHALTCPPAPTPNDADGDGFSPPADCDDNDASRYPGAPDPVGDGIDQNCDGRDGEGDGPEPVENVVMVLVDDMRLDEYAYMPKTQSLLGDEGVTFTQAVHNSPLCCPARATLLTGQRSKNHDVNTNKPAQGEGYIALDHSNTLPIWFQDGGYFTSFLGKYMNGYGQDGLDPDVPNNQEITPGWTDFQALVRDIKYFNYTINDNGTLVDFGTDPEDYQTDVLTERAIESIDEAVADDQPFYLWISTQAPHGYNGNPPDAAPRHESMFDGAVAPQAPSWNEANVSDKPGYVRSARRLTTRDIRDYNRTWEHRLESLQAVDDMVESLYLKLAAVDELDNTLFIFYSDNGYLLGEHRLTGKIRPYEESIRVPFVMRGGPFVGGQTVDHLVSSVDIVPTIVAQTGITPGLVMDGLDLSGVLTDPGRYENRAVIIEMVEGPGYDAIRTERWIWVEYLGSARELYDLEADPYQLDSKHKANGVYAEVRAELSALLATQRDCTGQACIVYNER